MKKILIIGLIILGTNLTLRSSEQKKAEETLPAKKVRKANIDYNKMLLNGVERNNITLVNNALKGGANVNFQDKNGNTALMTAALEGNKEAVELLLKAGANANLQNKDNETALIFAGSGTNPEVMQLLIYAGADINLQDKNGDTPLMNLLGEENKLAMAKLLINAGIELDTQNEEGDTALIRSARYGDKEIAELLIKAGADLNIQDNCGDSALIQAARNGDKVIIKLLLEAGADTTIKKDAEGNTFFDYIDEDEQQIYDKYITSPIAKTRKKQICTIIASIGKLTPDVENLVAEYCL